MTKKKAQPTQEAQEIIATQEAQELTAGPEITLELQQEVAADMARINRRTIKALRDIKEFVDAGRFAIEGGPAVLEKMIQQNERAQYSETFIRYMAEALADLRQQNGGAEITLYSLYTDTAGDGFELFVKLLEKVDERREADEEAARLIQDKPKPPEPGSTLPKITLKETKTLDIMLDKPNSLLWSYLTEADGSGQYTFAFDTSGKTKNQATVLYSINFDALDKMDGVKITKQLTPTDRRIYEVAAALYNAGNSVISVRQIYLAMGGKSESGSTSDYKRINDSLTKMEAAKIIIDNEDEARKFKNYPHFKYDGRILPFERVEARINGKLSDAAIHLFREPPLVSFARGRKQITTINRRLLEAPISKTDANIAIEEYLIQEISHMKNDPTFSRKMRYDTIYKACGIKTDKQRQRAPEKFKKILDHFKSEKAIADYTLAPDGIIIQVKPPKKGRTSRSN